jgi:hypothetical protein
LNPASGLDRAGARPNLPLTDAADLHLLADGARVDGWHDRNGHCVFDLARRPGELRLVSRAGSPADLGVTLSFEGLCFNLGASSPACTEIEAEPDLRQHDSGDWGELVHGAGIR